MGQRFSADEVILQKLMYNEVQEINGEKRDLPSGLDVPAAFGLSLIHICLGDLQLWPKREAEGLG